MPIHSCNTSSCVSLFQDKLYGPGMRVHNLSKKGAKIRCTVCGTERDNVNKVQDTKHQEKGKKKK